MKPLFNRVGAAALVVIFLLTGCAVQTGSSGFNTSNALSWRGRLALQVEANPPQTQAQYVTGGFELTGSPQAGELTLFTPLGTTAAALSWSAQTAILRDAGGIRHFESLEALISQTFGTEIPVLALFAWLAGDTMMVAGWRVDLSQYANGRITARRTQPAPLAELRLVLEQSP